MADNTDSTRVNSLNKRAGEKLSYEDVAGLSQAEFDALQPEVRKEYQRAMMRHTGCLLKKLTELNHELTTLKNAKKDVIC